LDQAPKPIAPLIWVLADERQGTANQCLGVADALGFAYEVKEIGHSGLAFLPNFLLGRGLSGVRADLAKRIRPPWPDLVISGGRRTVPAARYIKHQANYQTGGSCFLAHVMHPGRAGAGAFDLIAVPSHDRAGGANLYTITGAPHRVTEAALDQAAGRWRGDLEKHAPPLIGLLLGGATRQKPFTGAQAAALGARVGGMTAAAGGSLIVSTSPRTGNIVDQVAAAAKAAGAPPVLVHRWSPEAENPYLGILALADHLVVSGDSVSMCSEACAAGKPVYIWAPPGFAAEKHLRFHAELFAKGHARPLPDYQMADDQLPNNQLPAFETWTHAPLNTSLEIADEIRRRMGFPIPH